MRQSKIDIQARWGSDFGIPRCILPTAVCLRLRDVEGLILQARTHYIESIHNPVKVSNSSARPGTQAVGDAHHVRLADNRVDLLEHDDCDGA